MSGADDSPQDGRGRPGRPADRSRPTADDLVAPDMRLLAVLVAIVLATTGWMFLAGDDEGTTARLGSVASLAERAAAGPVRLAELPHLVVARTPIRDSPVLTARWGENTGAVLLDDREQLVVLETSDPVDDEQLVWCPSRDVFEHPQGVRTYAPDGLLLRGDGTRGMDRRALVLSEAGEVLVDDDRWVSGAPRRSTDTAFAPRGASCVE